MKWLRRVQIKRGNVIVIDKPELKQAFILAQAPDDAICYVFKDYKIFLKWCEKKKRVLPRTPEVLPPEQQLDIVGKDISERESNIQQMDAELELLRKQRLDAKMRELKKKEGRLKDERK